MTVGCERCELERLTQRLHIEYQRRLARTAHVQATGIDHQHDLRRVGRHDCAVCVDGIRDNLRAAQSRAPFLESMAPHACDGGPGTRRIRLTEREVHALDVVGNVFLERKRNDLQLTRTTAHRQLGLSEQNVDAGNEQDDASPECERCGLRQRSGLGSAQPAASRIDQHPARRRIRLVGKADDECVCHVKRVASLSQCRKCASPAAPGASSHRDATDCTESSARCQ